MRRALPFLALFPLTGCGSAETLPSLPPAPTISAPTPLGPGPALDAGPKVEALAPAPRTVDEVAAELLRLANANDAAGVVALFGGPMREVLPLEKAGPWLRSIVEAKGPLKNAVREPGRGGERSGVFRFDAERGAWRVELSVDGAGKVLGLKFTAPPPPDPEVKKSTLPLGLPFRGQWLVFWGGASLEVNQHVTHKSQRRAADLVVVDEAGKTHRGDGKKNADYYAYGQEVVAVADGTVITAVDGVADNEPGAMNAYMAPGNMIIVRHDDALYSVYAHLVPGKLRVKVGAKVKRGTVLGLCGNSGNSSEAHLHFQLQDGPLFEKSYGVEPVFQGVSVTRDGVAEKRAEYTWLKGDRVGEAPSPAKKGAP